MVRAAEHAVAGRDAEPAVLLGQAQHSIRDDMVMDVDVHLASCRTGAGRRPCASLRAGSRANSRLILLLEPPGFLGPAKPAGPAGARASERSRAMVTAPATVGV